MAKITIKETEVSVIKIADTDNICLTDILKSKDGDFFVTDWLRNRNTLEYIGIWEQIKNESGLNNFKISVKEFAEKTNAILENLNSVFINEKLPQQERLQKLNHIAIQQMKVLHKVENRKLLM